MDFAADIALFYSDFGQTATLTPAAGGAPVTGLAILDMPGAVILGGEQIVTDYSLQYPLATFPNIKRGDAIMVAGVAYTAREAAQLIGADGLEAVVPLAKA
ncbi:MAG: hypothetical protein KKF85_03395 [Gammaproteobacteria bacterium]|nr:hypothetical protein [Rhodocyclaceae bacterium]MBU3908868.1 hypothetical protein [Gammaproteobacteria bacterium]MBU3987735.1 hypothetical protein [Gammaproteobacteria bacterium]MBU4003346.1 hypothetical protein [Gammaproteobacteria bacterium]MBU4021817.1 hypothetical protein [Gammaproteobacteria bacterium]